MYNHYKLMRKNQTLEFSQRMAEKYSFNHPRARLTVREVFKILETYVDSSDPDVSLPNMVHMFQTAEGIRKAGHPDWFQLVGLIHDMGKIMFLWGDGENQRFRSCLLLILAFDRVYWTEWYINWRSMGTGW